MTAYRPGERCGPCIDHEHDCCVGSVVMGTSNGKGSGLHATYGRVKKGPYVWKCLCREFECLQKTTEGSV